MAKNITKRNEDAPFFFEKVLAGIEFLTLLEQNSLISRLQIKPDRKDGSSRRIEDLTKFYKDGKVEVIQMKHTLVSGTKLGFSDLWTVNVQTANGNKNKKEGTNIFKFLKSWRVHTKTTKKILLTLTSNKAPNDSFKAFFKDIEGLRDKSIKWSTFYKKYKTELQSIETNCSNKAFVSNKELKDFISTLNYQKVSDIDGLEKELEVKLKSQGIAESSRVQAFITRVTKKFVSDDVDILPSDVVALIDRVKTGLLQEVLTPINYIQRPDLEKKILEAIEVKKKEGGFVFLFSPSGSGKTVLLSRLAEKNPDFFPYFCRIRPFEAVRSKSGYSNNNRLNSSWFKADIIQRCNEFGLLPVSVSITDEESFIDKTFDESLSILSKKALERPSKKIVIIIDALDQVQTDKYNGKSILDAIPPVKYPGVVFLLSTWGEKYLPTSIKNLPQSSSQKLGIDLFFTEKEISEYFKQIKITLTRDQVSLIKRKTNGLVISIFYLGRKIKQSSAIDVVISSPGQYDEVFEWYKPIWSSLTVKEKECLGYLCFHFAKVKREDLRRIVGSSLNHSAYDNLLGTISPFIDTTGGFIEPYHDSFRRFIVSTLSKYKTSYHNDLARYYSNNDADSFYGRKYVIKHLEVSGIRKPAVQKIYKKLDATDFFGKVLKSNLDDPTKVEIGKSFVSYFDAIKDTKRFLRYAILSSNIYPTIYGEDAYKKAYIGTEKLVAEVENELLLPKRSQSRDQREWVFKRLAIGNILKKKADRNSQNLSTRFLDDSLFRINLNSKLLWDEDAKHDFWNHASEITEAYVNTGQYIRALNFYKKGIKFEKPNSKTKGLLGTELVKIHLQNFSRNKKETLNEIMRSSKLERLLFYLGLINIREKISNLKDLKSILKDEKIKNYLYDEKKSFQSIEFSEALAVYGPKDKNYKINKVINKLKIDIPYFHHSFTYWGDMGEGRNTFLRWVTLKSFINKDFDLKDFYAKALKDKFKNSSNLSEYQNNSFIDVLSIESDLYKNALLLQTGKIKWIDFWSTFKNALKKYKEMVDKINSSTDSHISDTRKNYYPYRDDLPGLIEDGLNTIQDFFPNKMLSSIKEIEDILNLDYLYTHPGLLERLIRIPELNNQKIKDKIDVYIEKLLELDKKEVSDNMSKSTSLQDLATLTAKKGYPELAETIYIQSLKYSRGLWSKGDLRFYNFVDSARTQKKDQLDYALKCIEKVSSVVEGGWYWRLDLLESAAYSDLNLALDYAYDFIVSGEVNQNEALVRIISTYIKNNPYSSLKEVLPLYSLINFHDERGHDPYENVSRAFYLFIKCALRNKDYAKVSVWIDQYFEKIRKDVPPSQRVNLINDFIKFADNYEELKKVKKDFGLHLAYLQKQGFSAAPKSSSEYEVSYEGIDLKKLRIYAKKDQVVAVIKSLELYVKKPGYFTEKLVSEIIPHLSIASIKKIKSWAKQNKVDIEGSYFFIALIKKAVSENNRSFLKKVSSEIIKFQSSVEHFHSSHLIRDLNEVEFPGKRSLLKKLLLISIRSYAGDGYSLPSVFSTSSDAIDDNFIELKKWSYEAWKDLVEKSIRLSTTK